jgi:hypothetical protein
MKNMLALSALASIVAAGCAGTSGGNGATTAAAAPASGIAYCHAENLDRSADALTCNWAKTAREACDNPRTRVTVRAASVTEGPAKGGMCPSGDRLVYVTTK